MMKFARFLLLFLAFIYSAGALPVFAQDSDESQDQHVEVMSVEGNAYVSNSGGSRQSVKEGDLLSVDDIIEMDSDSALDFAYDRDWSNVVHLEGGSKVKLESVYPALISLEKGGVMAKLKELSKDSSFQVETPTAVAVVRGTEYRTTVEDGQAQVFNFSDSQVYVFAKDDTGNLSETPAILENAQASGVISLGSPPPIPRQMTVDEREHGERIRGIVENRVQENRARGRVGRLPDVRAIEKIERENRLKFGEGRMAAYEKGGGAQEKMKQVFERQGKFMQAMDRARESHELRRRELNPERGQRSDDGHPDPGGPPGGGGPGASDDGSGQMPSRGHQGPPDRFRENDQEERPNAPGSPGGAHPAFQQKQHEGGGPKQGQRQGQGKGRPAAGPRPAPKR